MDNKKSDFPYKVNSFVDDGINVDIWCYHGLPEGMTRAHPSDLYVGRPYLYRIRHRLFLSDVFRPATEEFVMKCLAKGKPIYIKYS